MVRYTSKPRATNVFFRSLGVGVIGEVASGRESSSLTCEENGSLTPLPRDQWLEAVRSRPSPQSRGLPRHDRILQIDQASPTTAFVKLNCAIPPRFFTDYLSLLKVEGRWQVAQKVFATERRD